MSSHCSCTWKSNSLERRQHQRPGIFQEKSDPVCTFCVPYDPLCREIPTCKFLFSPPARRGSLDFMSTTFLLIPPSSSFLLLPPQPQAPSLSGHFRASTTSSDFAMLNHKKSPAGLASNWIKLVLNVRSLFLLWQVLLACPKLPVCSASYVFLESVFHIFPFVSFLSLFSEPFFLHLSGESGDASGFYVSTSSRSVASIRSTPLHFSAPPPWSPCLFHSKNVGLVGQLVPSFVLKL